MADYHTHSGLRRVAHRLVKCMGLSLMGLGLLVVVVTVTPLVIWWGGWLAGPWTDPESSVLIVLGGSSTMGDTMLGESSYWRAVYAVLAWRSGRFQTVIVTGRGASESIRIFLEANGVPPGAIVVEARSESTRQNALFVKDLLKGRDVPVLLTSDYHMFRAVRTFEKVGINVLPRPFPDARKRGTRWISRWSAFLDLTVETGKICYYLLRGWI